MSSAAERKRRRKERLDRARAAARTGPETPAAAGGGRKVIDRAAERAYRRREDALDMLARKGRLGARRLRTARTYGALIRNVQISDGASIRSFLELRPRGGAGGQALADLSGIEWVAECQWRLARAQMALGWNADLIAVLGLVCGVGQHPREIARGEAVRKDADTIETLLMVALDQLADHWDHEGFGGIGDWRPTPRRAAKKSACTSGAKISYGAPGSRSCASRPFADDRLPDRKERS